MNCFYSPHWSYFLNSRWNSWSTSPRRSRVSSPCNYYWIRSTGCAGGERCSPIYQTAGRYHAWIYTSARRSSTPTARTPATDQGCHRWKKISRRERWIPARALPCPSAKNSPPTSPTTSKIRNEQNNVMNFTVRWRNHPALIHSFSPVRPPNSPRWSRWSPSAVLDSPWSASLNNHQHEELS